MNHKIMLANGSAAEITQEEAEKIAAMVHPHYEGVHMENPAECNHKYLEKAKSHITALTGEDDLNEKKLKYLIYKQIYGFTKDDAELLYETMEAAIGMHMERILEKMGFEAEK